MSSRVVSCMLLCVAVALSASAQSLGSIAQKERERREKNKERGVEAREFSETEIFGDEEESADPDAPDEGEAEDESAEPAKKSPVPERIDIPIEGDDTQATEDESRDRKRQEIEWRTRFRDARERVAHAREQKGVLDGIHYVEGIKYVDENGNVVIESLDHLRRLVAQANEELQAAEQALRNLEEEARRAGVPPGWLR